MSGFGAEVDVDGTAVALGAGWFKELGTVASDPLMGWRAAAPDGRQVLQVPVNDRELAIQALVMAAGLENNYVVRWSE